MKLKKIHWDPINLLLQTWMLIAVNLLVAKSLFFQMDFNTIAFISIIAFSFLVVSQSSYLFYTFVFLPSTLLLMAFGLSLIPVALNPLLVQFYSPITGLLEFLRGVINTNRLEAILSFMVNHFLGYATKIPAGYDRYMMGVCILATSAIFLFLRNRRHKLWFSLPLLFFIIQWLRYFDVALSYLNLYLIGYLVYLIVNGDTTHFAFKPEEAKERRRVLLLYGLGLSLLISFTASLALAIYPIEKVNSAVSRFIPSFIELRSGYNQPANQLFSFSNTIYKPYGDRLGGSITLKKDLVMKVKGNGSGLYLRGRVSDRYDGKNWSSTSPDYTMMRQYTEVESDKATSAYKLDITYTNFESATVFAPYSFYASDINPRKVYQNLDGALFYKKGPLDGKLATFMVKGIDSAYKPALQVGDSADMRYRSLPRTVPDRIRLMALQATLGAMNNREKMERLVSFLSTSYTYSLDVTDVPDGVDFVTFFLTDSEEGYCTYFASALAVMGRTMGVPTRYVEGFVIPKQKASDGSYHVTADLAHAWVEAYIEGEGWVVFEATPPYGQIAELLTDGNDTDLLVPGQFDGLDRETGDEDIDDIFGDGDIYVNQKPFISWQMALMVVILLVFALTLRRILMIQAALAIHFKASHRQNALKQFYQLEQLVAFVDTQYYQMTTPEKVINRIFDLMRFTSLDKNVILLIVNKVLYSPHDVSGSDVVEIRRVYKAVDDFVVARLGRPKYWFIKYGLNGLTLKKRG